jgi:DNA-directed RNA polymerase subunit K/omega
MKMVEAGVDIDIEKCVAASNNNRYDMILNATARAKEIMRQHGSRPGHSHAGAVVGALLELQTGRLTTNDK